MLKECLPGHRELNPKHIVVSPRLGQAAHSRGCGQVRNKVQQPAAIGPDALVSSITMTLSMSCPQIHTQEVFQGEKNPN